MICDTAGMILLCNTCKTLILCNLKAVYLLLDFPTNWYQCLYLQIPLTAVLVSVKFGLGLGNISKQYCNTGVCNNRYRRLFYMSIILLILQCSTVGLSKQSKYASAILKFFSAVTHNTLLMILSTIQIL